MSIPEYRVRLFLTVDLVGSTAYKFSSAKEKRDPAQPHPQWVNQFRQFYQQFPKTLLSKFAETSTGRIDGHARCPRVWKTIGDEILFCCRVYSIEHVACCVTAFIQALEEMGKSFEANDIPLDVKGAGWLAAFPAENISIEIFNGKATGEDDDLPTEPFEEDADAYPHRYDFLGTGIDTGFRIAKNASAERLTASIGLAFILCRAAIHGHFIGSFEYHGRERFKGVNRDQPYPVVSIVSERDEKKRMLKERERMVNGEQKASPVALADFLREFMVHEKIDLPMLPEKEGSEQPKLPQSYETFCTGWLASRDENAKRDKGIDDAAEAAENDPSDQPLPAEVLKSLDQENQDVTH